MASNAKENKAKNLSNLFSSLGQRRRTAHDDSLFVNEDTTAWELYNAKANEVDQELIRDWNDSLNTLLIFVRFLSFSH